MTGISDITGRAVYILIREWSYEGDEIFGVFSSREKAIKKGKSLDGALGGSFRVEEHFID